MGGTFIHSQSVLPLPQKVSVQMRGGFVSMPAKLFSCINNSRVKQTRSFSHYAYANELKLHSNTLAKQSSELTRLRTTSTSVSLLQHLFGRAEKAELIYLSERPRLGLNQWVDFTKLHEFLFHLA